MILKDFKEIRLEYQLIGKKIKKMFGILEKETNLQ